MRICELKQREVINVKDCKHFSRADVKIDVAHKTKAPGTTTK